MPVGIFNRKRLKFYKGRKLHITMDSKTAFRILITIFDFWCNEHTCEEKEQLRGAQDCPHEASVHRVQDYFAELIAKSKL